MLGSDYESLRKAVVNQNINDIFKFVKGKEDLRKIADGNEHSLFRILNNETTNDLKKVNQNKDLWALRRLEPSIKDEVLLATENNYDKLWNVLEKHTNSKLIKPLRTLHNPKN